MHGRTRYAALALATVLAVAFPVRAAAQPSIVTNGDFEVPVVTGNLGFGYFAPPGFDAWTVDYGSIDIVRELWTAASGAQSVDLNGACCDPGSISQVLPTSSGTTYTLRFAFAGNPDPNPVCGSSPVIKRTEVFWGGTSRGVFTFDATGHTLADPGWRRVAMPVTASAGETTLRFASLIPGACGPAIDDVAVTEGSPQATRPGRGCGDKHHVHAGEVGCRNPPR